MPAAIVTPARHASTRLPGKPLLKQTGKYLIQHVHERACLARRATRVVVATDDPRIAAAVEGFGGKVALTRRGAQGFAAKDAGEVGDDQRFAGQFHNAAHQFLEIDMGFTTGQLRAFHWPKTRAVSIPFSTGNCPDVVFAGLVARNTMKFQSPSLRGTVRTQ